MDGAEQLWVVSSGVVGLVCLVAGSFVAAVPPPDALDDEVVRWRVARRSAVLVGSGLTASAGALLIWPVAAVAASNGGAWSSLGMFSVGLAVLGAGVFWVVGLSIATAAWRPTAEPAGTRLLLDLAHLGTWAVSAPVGGLLVVTTTAAGVQSGLFGPVVVVTAVAKVATAIVEVSGTGRSRGWNAGGWAAGSSGYATVVWYALVLAALA